MPTEDRNSLGPMARIAAPTLDWSQGILEPQKPGWKPAAGDGLAMPRHSVKSVIKTLENQCWQNLPPVPRLSLRQAGPVRTCLLW